MTTAAPRGARPSAPGDDRLRIVFVGQAVERKGLPLLLRAFEALREHIPTELTVIGPTPRGARAADARRHAASACSARSTTRPSTPSSSAPTCCAPRRWAERASGWCSPRRSRPAPRWSPPTSPATATSCATASTAILVPAGDAQALAETLRDLYDEPERRAEHGAAPRPPTSSASRGRASPPR